MKKVVLILIAIAAFTFASCTSNSSKNDVQNDSTVVDTVMVDTLGIIPNVNDSDLTK